MRIFKNTHGDISPKLVEYIGMGLWRIRWNIHEEIVNDELRNNRTTFVYNEAELNYKPSVQEIKNIILDEYNKEIDEKILSGFVWNEIPVWLSTENQFNYKSAYDLAIQTNGASLPITFKFGTTKNPIYHTFNELDDISDFYVKAMNYTINTLNEGWTLKDNLEWGVYSDELGTKSDPIKYINGMSLHLGKYYSQNGIIYLCSKNSEKVVQQDLVDLVDIYLTKI